MSSIEAQTKYESQLPKPDRLSFDRIFGYTASGASIIGLIGAPFIIKDQGALGYLYMGFLSLLVLVLLVHAVLIEKRKLHRYAQSVFFTHFSQHVVRNSLAELQKNGKDKIENNIEKILDAIAHCFTITSGKWCRATLIEMDSHFELKVAARDAMSSNKAKKRHKQHTLDANTDFANLWYSKNGCSRYYLNNNIPDSWLAHEYQNSSFLEDGECEVKNLFGIKRVKKWPLAYRSALILPVRYVSEFTPPKESSTLVPHWDYWGFLCVDSISTRAFDERYSPELGAVFADMLYTYLNQSEYILDTFKNTNNQN
jgi:hypothetical protein